MKYGTGFAFPQMHKNYHALGPEQIRPMSISSPCKIILYRACSYPTNIAALIDSKVGTSIFTDLCIFDYSRYKFILPTELYGLLNKQTVRTVHYRQFSYVFCSRRAGGPQL